MAVLGRNFIIGVDSAGGTSYTAVAGQKTGTINITADTVETTTKSSGWAKTYEANQYSWEVTLSGVYDLTGTGNLVSLLVAGTQVGVQCDIGGTASGADKFSGTGVITSISSTGDQGDITTYDITIQGSGALGITA